jgi:Lhr-like helicase
MPGIVTSGTGSGKTESFLLPVLAAICPQAVSWQPARDGIMGRRWWQREDGSAVATYKELPGRPGKQSPDRSPFRPHRAKEKRPAAVRALILYPMNALVEDQLVRIRRALDSEGAREVARRHFNGNLIFFGRYTSATPVTGFDVHPRVNPTCIPDLDIDKYLSRRRRKLNDLLRAVRSTQLTQEEARRRPSPKPADDPRYQFPSHDGAEMLSRWDMQKHPPDILITNVSMLSAMLAREVDAPIFSRTRRWLKDSDEAYFYLVLDELHLHRGSAGTEVACLLRLLIDRLGLSRPDRRHKLRILASSASLPMEGAEREESLAYLNDMFGLHGTWARSGQPAAAASCWADAVERGQALPEVPASGHKLNADPYRKLVAECGGTDHEPATEADPRQHEAAWRAVAADLLQGNSPADLVELVRRAVEEAGLRLAKACFELEQKRARATVVSRIAASLFGRDGLEGKEAVRGLLLVRGAGDSFERWFPKQTVPRVPSFRVHTFFRSIEGMFASAARSEGVDTPFRSPGRIVGRLGVERDVALDRIPDGRTLRRLELLYCECCGELFFAGKRARGSGDSPELLPTDPAIDGLPDAATSQLFEELTHEGFAVFWPSESREPADGSPFGSWRRAGLAPDTGQVHVGVAAARKDGRVAGHLYHRPSNSNDQHKRKNDKPGTAVPYQCPACGEDYSERRVGMRLSPLRSFRTGFAKSTQLLATELFDLQRLTGDPEQAKLVSFSDSRQDAARASLDIERRHHEDVRRQLIIQILREAQAARPGANTLRQQIEDVKQRIKVEVDAENYNALDELQPRMAALRKQLAESGEPTIALAEATDTSALGPAGFRGHASGRSPLRPLLRRFAQLGIHPVDPTGLRRFRIGEEGGDETRIVAWEELFRLSDPIDWRDAPRADLQEHYDNARSELVRASLKLFTEVLFSKTYFSLEETGLGYVCPPLGHRDPKEHERLSAFLRVLGDAYRFSDSPWPRSRPARGWSNPSDVPTRNRVMRLARAKWPDESERSGGLTGLLEAIHQCGHEQALIVASAVCVMLVGEEGDYWRCKNCSRAHLHRGVELCTRCFLPLPVARTGLVKELRRHSFLARRIERPGADAFRLHCEELTGQTDDPADRQRKFKGILLPGAGPDGQRIEPYRNKEIIDLLAVTTTMEVGIDVGQLRSVFEANMPPQRFNYQQRVGRAGRRGQAFSLVLTVCRSKSHDLYYFRNPHRITGDLPPPPFLTRSQATAPRRFVRKAWLCAAFESLRDECKTKGQSYPADDAPADIHGEFVPRKSFFEPGSSWPGRLRQHLEATMAVRDRIIDLLLDCQNLACAELEVGLDVEGVMKDLERLREASADTLQVGLAHTMAEAGYLPMYGMPTRVRNLYLGYERESTLGAKNDYERRWQTIDRDSDLGVFEHSPGALVVKDKKLHVCVGFTGPLMEFRYGTAKHPVTISSKDPALSNPFWMLACERCGAWSRSDEEPTEAFCAACGNVLAPECAKQCRTPAGYRTNFRPKSLDTEERAGGRFRAICAEGSPVQMQPNDSGRTNLRIQPQERVRTYRLNRGKQGPESDPLGAGFEAVAGTQKLGTHTELTGQYIAWPTGETTPAVRNFSQDDKAEPVKPFWLASPKTTDALFLAPDRVQPGLWLHRVGPASSGGLTAVRAAALSATFLLVARAADELDIDPEEFDVIEPRPATFDGRDVPLLQITDRLVNGAGFCRRLAQADSLGDPMVARLVRSMTTDSTAEPQKTCQSVPPNAVSPHHEECDRACYVCMHRYGNQPYHGLLDWRLGLSFLAALNDGCFNCCLDGDFSGAPPYLRDWPAWAEQYADEMVRRFGGKGGAVGRAGRLPAFRLGPKPHWAVVVHPFWDTEQPTGVVREAADALAGSGVNVQFIDTFHLARLQVTAREQLEAKWPT